MRTTRFIFGFLVLSSLLLTSCYNEARHCADYKTGTFEFTYMENGEEKTAKFVRTQDFSIDYIGGVADSSSVRWINDCEFILKKLRPTTNLEKKPIHMKILSTTADSYTFEYKYAVNDLNRSNRTERGVAKKVK
ncbi:hypothetical protein IA57_11880 [Mangrovimonas yunxiaonensis]|uniref:DNA topoisomerase IV subunit A n=1 Tax=Mangrovimonas yunxiaonensis TaxID=1197477 RepID=A0A084THE0_9FLAO|nr:hypothetical protein [Mangrovimonas yunxiaonensis]KFB00126.1 hypothetical protein IA57_11880 [Mangrovimonas yunxiaonensis]GGH42028.1 hypothetical protein GCM10011364_13270 [Mangrovimonas yunxiaonensis]